MELTATARENFVEEYLAFQAAAEKIRNRFYDFLVAHNPEDFANYSIYPFEDSTVPLPVDHFKWVPYTEGSNGFLVFDGPSSENEIKATVLRDIEESEDSPFALETHKEWYDQDLYMEISDEYLDDPDRWEAMVLAGMTLLADENFLNELRNVVDMRTKSTLR